MADPALSIDPSTALLLRSQRGVQDPTYWPITPHSGERVLVSSVWPLYVTFKSRYKVADMLSSGKIPANRIRAFLFLFSH